MAPSMACVQAEGDQMKELQKCALVAEPWEKVWERGHLVHLDAGCHRDDEKSDLAGNTRVATIAVAAAASVARGQQEPDSEGTSKQGVGVYRLQLIGAARESGRMHLAAP